MSHLLSVISCREKNLKCSNLFAGALLLLPCILYFQYSTGPQKLDINSLSNLYSNYKTSLSTMSGNIAASVYPLGQPSSMSLVDIQCTSGSASMTLHPIVNDPQASLRNLSTNFRGSSGGLSIRFPSTWEGEVISHLSNGSVRHAWEDLRVVNDGLRFRATKGNGSGQLNIWYVHLGIILPIFGTGS